MDGIDIALLHSDGKAVVEAGPFSTASYDDAFRAQLRAVVEGRGDAERMAREITLAHASAISAFIKENSLTISDIDLIGFHGHTILHQPDARRTWQIGEGDLLASLCGIDVIGDFRSQDVAAGGQGAPLAPLYHAALAASLDGPVAVLNIGGVANVTWVSGDAATREATMIAFDTGPGNALIDDWVARHGAGLMDTDGRLAGQGRVDARLLERVLAHRFFDQAPPKSLDRNEFAAAAKFAASLSVADGAASLTALTAAAVARAAIHFPEPPTRWLVSGGGRRNPVLMSELRNRLKADVDAVEAVGWQGDALEAQAFAYLAIRAARGLPLSLPGTTGVPRPTCGGTLYSRPA